MRSVCGMPIGYVSVSKSFSVPRWRYPTSGFASRIFSPSTFRMIRSTPWVDGCWGPKFSSISWTSKRVGAIPVAAAVSAARVAAAAFARSAK